MWENCFLLPILLIFSPFLIHNEFPHLGFPITETQLHVLKSAWPKWKVESWFKQARKVFVKGYLDFWITHWGAECCMHRDSQRTTFYFQTSSSLFCLSHFYVAFRGMNLLCQHFTQTFQKQFQLCSESGLQVLLLSQATSSPRLPDIVGSPFLWKWL